MKCLKNTELKFGVYDAVIYSLAFSMFQIPDGRLSKAVWVVAEFDDLIEDTVTTKGQYYSECDDDLPHGEWQKQFWGEKTYGELLKVKRKYDPDNHFTCRQCVGSKELPLPSPSPASTASVINASVVALICTFGLFHMLDFD